MRATRYILGFLLLTGVLLCRGLAQPSARGQTPSPDALRIPTQLVSLPVTVLDEAGRYVPNLTQNDFAVFEDGIKQQIEHFALHEEPISVVLLLDTSGSTRDLLEQIQTAALAFVEQLGDQDRVIPVVFDNEVKPLLTDWTADRALLTKAIENVHTGANWIRLSPPNAKPGERVTYFLNTRLYDAVVAGVDLLKQVQGRKALILLTDGMDTASRTLRNDTIRAVEELNTLVYTIHFTRSKRYHQTYTEGQAYLEWLVEKAGGRYFAAQDLVGKVGDAFRQIAEELSRQYSLGYYPTTGKAGTRRIQVQLNHPTAKFRVRTRKTYFLEELK